VRAHSPVFVACNKFLCFIVSFIVVVIGVLQRVLVVLVVSCHSICR